MATYTELFNVHNNSELQNKIAVATSVKAHQLLAGTPTTDQVAWAYLALKSPLAMAQMLFAYVLAANKSASIAEILGASDSVIQANVDDAVDALIAGGAFKEPV